MTRSPTSAPHAPRLFGLVSSLGYLVGAVLVAAIPFLFFNPSFGHFEPQPRFEARLWPWDLFWVEGRFQFLWQPPQVVVLAAGATALTFLACAILPSGRVRGVMALGAVLLMVTMLTPDRPRVARFLEPALAAALVAGLAMMRMGRVRGGRSLVGGVTIVLVLLLFMPVPHRGEILGELSDATYGSIATLTVKALVGAIADYRPQDLDPFLLVLLHQTPYYAMMLLATLGLLTSLGVRGRWTPWVGLAILALGAIGPITYLYVDGLLMEGGDPFMSSMERGLLQASAQFRGAFDIYCLPTAMALVDLARPRSS